MKKILNNVKQIKTTLLGLVLIGFGIYGILHLEEYNEYLIGGIILSGIVLVVSPDTYITLLEKAIGLKKNKDNDPTV